MPQRLSWCAMQPHTRHDRAALACHTRHVTPRQRRSIMTGDGDWRQASCYASRPCKPVETGVMSRLKTLQASASHTLRTAQERACIGGEGACEAPRGGSSQRTEEPRVHVRLLEEAPVSLHPSILYASIPLSSIYHLSSVRGRACMYGCCNTKLSLHLCCSIQEGSSVCASRRARAYVGGGGLASSRGEWYVEEASLICPRGLAGMSQRPSWYVLEA